MTRLLHLLLLAALAATGWAADRSPLVMGSDGRPTSLPAGDRVRLVNSAGTFWTVLNAPATAARTVTLPDATTTLAGLSVAQTFTADQTISGTLTLSGNTTGVRLIRREGTAGYLTLNGGDGDGGTFGGQIVAGGNTWAAAAGHLFLDHGTAVGARVRVRDGGGATIADFVSGRTLLGAPTDDGATRLQVNGGGLFSGVIAIRGAAQLGALTVATASEIAPQSISAWDATKHALLAGPATSTTSTALAASVDQATSECDLIALTPLTAWQPLNLRAGEVRVRLGGSTSSTLAIASTGITAAVPITWGTSSRARQRNAYNASVASTGTLDLDVASGGEAWAGILVVSNAQQSNALIATRTVYAVSGRGTSFTSTQLHTQNGTSGGAAFTLSCVVGGNMRVTNDHGAATTVDVVFYGAQGL